MRQELHLEWTKLRAGAWGVVSGAVPLSTPS